jgi:hypothetical protein
MLIVLSPAKKLVPGPDVTAPSQSDSPLIDEAQELVENLRGYSREGLQGLMGISEKLAGLNHERFDSFVTPFTDANASPAAHTFAGDVYVGLDAGSLSEKDLTWSQDRVAILSSLYGVLRPLDRMQPYRLEMGTKLPNVRGKNLYEFWGERITDVLNERLERHADRTLVNLASQEYFKAVRPKQLAGEVITPVFQEVRDGKAKTISFLAKKARGLMTRFAIQERLKEPSGLKGFDVAGYRFHEDLSSDTKWVFRRPYPN